MTDLKLNDNYIVKLHDSTDEMSMDLFFQFNQYGLLEYETGASMADVDKKFTKLDTLLVGSLDQMNRRNFNDALEFVKSAIMERDNLHQAFWNIQNKIHFPSLQFGCFIYSVNDKKLEDYSQGNLTAVMQEMSKNGMKYGTLRQTLEALKKKSILN